MSVDIDVATHASTSEKTKGGGLGVGLIEQGSEVELYCTVCT